MNPHIDNILVAVDLESGTESVLETATMLARSFNSKLMLMHVVPEVLPDTWTDDLDQEQLTKHLDEMKGGIEQQGVTVSAVELLHGKASYRICQYAEQKGADLIVLAGSRRRKSGARLGVTGDRVLRNSSKPVWLVQRSDGAAPSNILCAVDQSLAAGKALQYAMGLAGKFEARLTVLRVNEAMPSIYAQLTHSEDPSVSHRTKGIRSELRALVGELVEAGVDAHIEVREGIPHVEILATAADLECDLIVMGTEGMSNQPRTLVGSVTKKVTRAMPCSIVTVNDEDLLLVRLSRTIENIKEHMQEGEIQVGLGNPAEALPEYEQCLLDEPTFGPAWEGLAKAYEAMGDLNKADRCSRAADQIRRLKQA